MVFKKLCQKKTNPRIIKLWISLQNRIILAFYFISYKATVVDDPAKLDEVMKTLKNPFYVLFYATVKPETGKMWCPDYADPVIDQGFTAHPNCDVIVCPIPRESYKGNPNHPYRIHSIFKLQSIPSLYKINEGKSVKCLVENDCKVLKNVEELINA